MIFARDAHDREEFIKSIVDKNGNPYFNSAEELAEQFGTSGIGRANEFFNALSNKLGKQFVERLSSFRNFLYEKHNRGEFPYADYFEHIWQYIIPNNVIKYDTTIYLPNDLSKAGLKLKRPQKVFREPMNIQLVNAIVLDKKLVKSAFMPNMIPAFNKFIAQYLSTMMKEVALYFYYYEIKVLKQIKNTYVMKTEYPKPADVKTDTQWKLAYLNWLINEMRPPSIGKYNMIGKIGDTNPLSTTTPKAKLTKADFNPLCLEQEVILYTTPRQKSEFETLAYSTTFNPEYIKVTQNMITLRLDEAQLASGDEVLNEGNYWMKEIKKATTADPYETVYLCVPDTFACMKKFEVTTSSTWVLGQFLQTFAWFGLYTPLPYNIGIKIDLRTK